MDYIENLRADIKRDFDEQTFTKADFQSSISPSEKFRLEATNYWSKEPNWDLTKVELYDQATNDKLFDFFVNESQFFYSWLTKGNPEYFICAEDIFGGQTVIDLPNNEMASYSPNEDGFIWTGFHLSPDGNTLATVGCYWACSFEIKLFDFSNPLLLPLKEIKQIELLGNDEEITGWVDNETFSTRGFKRVYDGNFPPNLLSETPVQRLLKIDGTEL